jgi:hypothetical protein
MMPAETAAVRAVVWMMAGSAAGLPLLVVPKPDDPLVMVTIHLSVLVAFSVALAFHLAPLLDGEWFSGTSLGRAGRVGAAGVLLVVLVTGATGLVALATSAALRFDVSLQFLQLISALDIAWAATALVIGVRRLAGVRVAAAGALVLGIVCVWAIWHYLDVVGFTGAGGWIVDAREMQRLVLPYDMGAAAVAVFFFVVGVRRPAPATG